MKQLFNQFCDETTIHGFKEFYHARSTLSKTFWALVVIVGFIMTTIHIWKVVNNFCSETTKTQITLLKNDSFRYPPFVVSPNHFTDWLDLDKIKEFEFDLNTLLYTMSYFNYVHTHLPVNVSEAKSRLNQIMTERNLTNIYHLGKALSLQYPRPLLSKTEIVYSYFNEHGYLHYILNKPSVSNNSNVTVPEGFRHFKFQTFTNFETTQFHKTFKTMYNSTLIDEYVLYKRIKLNNDITNNNLKSSQTIFANVVGERYMYSHINVLLNGYDYFLRGSLYKWITTVNDSTCNSDKDALFFAECSGLCSKVYQPFLFKLCNLFTVPINYTTGDELDNLCSDDNELVNGSDFTKAKSVYKDCMADCMSSCHKWIYQISSVANPHQIALDKNLFVFGLVNLNYADIENMQVVSFMPFVTWDDALANIGGLLGLWLGGSIVSFFQLFYLFCCIPLENKLNLHRRSRNFVNKIILAASTRSSGKADVPEVIVNEEFEMKSEEKVENIEILKKEIDQLRFQLKSLNENRTNDMKCQLGDFKADIIKEMKMLFEKS